MEIPVDFTVDDEKPTVVTSGCIPWVKLVTVSISEAGGSLVMIIFKVVFSLYCGIDSVIDILVEASGFAFVEVTGLVIEVDEDISAGSLVVTVIFRVVFFLYCGIDSSIDILVEAPGLASVEVTGLVNEVDRDACTGNILDMVVVPNVSPEVCCAVGVSVGWDTLLYPVMILGLLLAVSGELRLIKGVEKGLLIVEDRLAVLEGIAVLLGM